LKNEVALLKNVERTQAQVMRSKKQELKAERNALMAKKRKLEYDIYDMLQVNFAIKDKLKRIMATCDE
jgi:predicted nucleic acid-binding protein